MAGAPASRVFGELTFEQIGSALSAGSILCLPVGSMEQHGPHLPLNTDSVIAEAFTGRLAGRWGAAYDLWQLPTFAVGLSHEHAWAAGTLSLSIAAMTATLRDVAREIVRATPARSLLLVNGHGGNRGLLEQLGRELRFENGINIATLHLGAIMSPVPDTGVPEIHAGRDETSVMLALAPHLVRREVLPELKGSPSADAIRGLILDPAASIPWSSDDPRLAARGVIGDPRGASAELGNAIVERMVERAEGVLKQLRENAGSERSPSSS